MTPDLQSEIRAEAQPRPEGFQKLPLLDLMDDLVVLPEKVPAHGLFELFLHGAEGFHIGLVVRVLRRSGILRAEKMQVIQELVHICTPVYMQISDLI